jgi:hypothetical protein
MAGFEPTTSRLLSECSTAKLHRPPINFKSKAESLTKFSITQCYYLRLKNSDTGTRTQVARVKAEYPNQLDYIGESVCECAR